MRRRTLLLLEWVEDVIPDRPRWMRLYTWVGDLREWIARRWPA
jgi:hypothetical protein